MRRNVAPDVVAMTQDPQTTHGIRPIFNASIVTFANPGTTQLFKALNVRPTQPEVDDKAVRDKALRIFRKIETKGALL